MALLEHLVHVFFVSALLVGVVMKLQPQFFQGVAVPGSSNSNSNSAAVVMDTTTTSTTLNCSSCPSPSAEEGFSWDKLYTDNPRVFKLEVNDNSFIFALSMLHPNYIRAKAFEFCVENREFLKISRQALVNGCVTPIANQIAMEVKNSPAVHYAEVNDVPVFPPGKNVLLEPGTSIVHINIPLADGRNFYFNFDVATTPLINVAEQFCTKNSKPLDLNTEEDLISCIKTVVPFMKQQLISIGFRAADEETSSTPSPASNEAEVVQNVDSAVASTSVETDSPPETPVQPRVVEGFFSVGETQLPYQYDHAKSPRENAEAFCELAWNTILADALSAINLILDRSACGEFVEVEANKTFQMRN